MSRVKLMKEMWLRPPTKKALSIHPEAQKIQNAMTKPLPPLTYKLQDLPENAEEYQFKPLGNTEHIPFQVERTKSGNLPVYKDYKEGGNRKLTIIRKITGDPFLMAEELKKVTSNSEVTIKVGSIVVTGFHKQNVEVWLQRLGF